MGREFVLLRMTNMRGVDLDLFDFDYDLTWAGLFVGVDEQVLGRYGSRDAASAEAQLSLVGLKHALEAALASVRVAHEKQSSPREAPRTAEQFPAARRLKDNACIHCHHVYDFRREERQASGFWRRAEVWVYPLPENLGLTLEVGQGDRVRRVADNSLAARLGVRAGDSITRLNGRPIASIADVQYALHRGPAQGEIPIAWQHEGKTRTGTLMLEEGWRTTDISWRWSLRGLEPLPGVHGEDLTAEEKKALGLAEKGLAFRQGNFLSTPARQAGVRQNDIIIGVDNKALTLTARQFDVYIRLNYQVGDEVTLNILRAGRRVDLPLKLPGKNPF